jgi:hypothetical protein
MDYELMEPGNDPAGRIFGWKVMQLASEPYVILRRNVFAESLRRNDLFGRIDTDNDGSKDSNNMAAMRTYIFNTFVAGQSVTSTGDLVDRTTELLGIRINSAQRDELIRYVDYNWENCDNYEVAQYGCTVGEYFAKRESFDPAVDANDSEMMNKVRGLLYVLGTLTDYYLK